MDLKIKYKGKNLSEAPETELNVNNEYYDMFQSELNNLLGFDKSKQTQAQAQVQTQTQTRIINNINNTIHPIKSIESESNLKIQNKKSKKIKKKNEKKKNIINNKHKNNSKENIILKSSSDSDIKLNIEENDYLAIKMMMKYFDI